MIAERELGYYYLNSGDIAIREPGSWAMYFPGLEWTKIVREEGVVDLDESILADMDANNASYLGPL